MRLLHQLRALGVAELSGHSLGAVDDDADGVAVGLDAVRRFDVEADDDASDRLALTRELRRLDVVDDTIANLNARRRDRDVSASNVHEQAHGIDQLEDREGRRL